MSDFEDRVAVVTGGAAGIGLAMARAFASRGAHLVLADIDAAALAAAKAELDGGRTRVLTVLTDVRDRDRVFALADVTYDAFGRAHIVCNNAGIAPVGPVLGADPQDWRTTMDVNFWGVVHGVDAFVPRMLAQREGGHVVNTASMAGLTGMLGFGMYCASKFAVVGLTESLRRELNGRNVAVSVLCPMVVKTEIGKHSRHLLRSAVPAPPDAEGAGANALAGRVIAAEEVGRRVVRAIERRDFYILTHREQREILRRRAARQDAVFEDDGWSD